MGKVIVIFVWTCHYIPPSVAHTGQMSNTFFQWLLTQDKLLIKKSQGYCGHDKVFHQG